MRETGVLKLRITDKEKLRTYGFINKSGISSMDVKIGMMYKDVSNEYIFKIS